MNPLLANVHRKRRHTEMYTAKPTQQTTQHQHQHQHQQHPPTRKYVPRQSSCSIPMQSSPFASCRRTYTGESSPSTYSPSSTGSCCRACRLGNPCPQQKLLSIASPTRILSSPNSPCPSSPYSPCPNQDDEVVFKRIKLTPLTIPSKRTLTSTYSSPANLTANTTSTSSTETSTSSSSSSSSESRNRNLETEFQVPSHFPQYNTSTNPIADTTLSSTAATDLEASNALLLQLHQQLLEYTRHYQHLVHLCAQSLQQQQSQSQSQSQYQTQITQPSQSIQQPLTGTADPTTNTLAHHLTMQQQQLLQMVPTIANEPVYNPYTNSNLSQYPSSSSYVHVQPSTGSHPTFSPLYSESFPTTTKEMNASSESYSHSYSQSSTTATPILMPIPVSSIARTMAAIATPSQSQSSSRSISSDTSASASATSYSSPWSSRAASPSPSPPSPSRAIESASRSQSAATSVTQPASQS